MKFFVVGLCVFAAAADMSPSADFKQNHRKWPTLPRMKDYYETGMRDFVLRLEAEDGTMIMEHGKFQPSTNGRDIILVIEGQITFIHDDGSAYVLKYYVDLNGNDDKYLPVFANFNHFVDSLTFDIVSVPRPRPAATVPLV